MQTKPMMKINVKTFNKNRINIPDFFLLPQAQI